MQADINNPFIVFPSAELERIDRKENKLKNLLLKRSINKVLKVTELKQYNNFIMLNYEFRALSNRQVKKRKL